MNIFIDTSIIIQENYFTGKKLERLGILSNQGYIKLYFTEVIEKEIIKNINSECEKIFIAEKTFKRQLENKFRIVKNYYNLSKLSIIEHEFLEYELNQKFNRFKEFAKIETIQPLSEFNISALINDYFENKPPFDSENKKNEFPDAISFKIAEDYLYTNGLKGMYLTIDSDFKNFNSNIIEIKNDLNQLLEEIIRDINPKIFDNENQILNAIKTDINFFIRGIIPEIELDVMIHHTELFEKYNIRISTESQRTIELNITGYEVFDITENLIGFKCRGNYISDIFYLLEEGTDKNTHDKILILEKLNLHDEGFIRYKGDFEITLYYDFEFPYKVIEESIEIGEEKAIKTILSI